MTTTPIDALVDELDARLADLPADIAHRAAFLATYRRTTEAVGAAVRRGSFADGAWVEQWTAVFGGYFLDAHDADRSGGTPTRPWRLAFSVAPDVHPLGHLLVGMNAHINYDLPQAMLDVLSPADFADPERLALRVLDHDRIDDILGGRVAAEDAELGGPRRVVDRLLGPANRLGSRRFLAESRGKVWENVLALQQARTESPDAYRTRVATTGFGVRLPPP